MVVVVAVDGSVGARYAKGSVVEGGQLLFDGVKGGPDDDPSAKQKGDYPA